MCGCVRRTLLPERDAEIRALKSGAVTHSRMVDQAEGRVQMSKVGTITRQDRVDCMTSTSALCLQWAFNGLRALSPAAAEVATTRAYLGTCTPWSSFSTLNPPPTTITA